MHMSVFCWSCSSTMFTPEVGGASGASSTSSARRFKSTPLATPPRRVFPNGSVRASLLKHTVLATITYKAILRPSLQHSCTTERCRLQVSQSQAPGLATLHSLHDGCMAPSCIGQAFCNFCLEDRLAEPSNWLSAVLCDLLLERLARGLAEGRCIRNGLPKLRSRPRPSRRHLLGQSLQLTASICLPKRSLRSA